MTEPAPIATTEDSDEPVCDEEEMIEAPALKRRKSKTLAKKVTKKRAPQSPMPAPNSEDNTVVKTKLKEQQPSSLKEASAPQSSEDAEPSPETTDSCGMSSW